jgi:hypothetical protein
MAFYSHPPIQLYAYAPMAIPNQAEFYAVYPSGGHPGMVDASAFYYDANPKGVVGQSTGKHFTRKESTDSGISAGTSSRKTSTTSSISTGGILEEPSEETIKEETPFSEPDDDLCEKITQQVEFYFSDANITKDKFLLKHVKRNKEGFVSLKLISSFKRVKHLTKDWRQVAFAIKKCSNRLEVNDLETKVRRLEELPPYDETTPSRTVVVLNLPMDRPTIEGVAEIFTACGDIVLVRILRPGNPIPADIKPYVAKHPEMTTKVCALVEYERTEFAQKAIKELHDSDDEDKMKVMELTATPLKNGNKKIEARKLAEKAAAMAAKAQIPQRKFSLQNNFAQPMLQPVGPRNRRVSLMANMKFAPIVEDIKENVVPRKQYSLNPDAPAFQMNADGTYSVITPRRKPVFYAAEGPQYMGLPTRRVSAFNNNFAGLESAAAGLKLPPNVMRMPKGPDNGKGFNSWCRQRMEPKRPSKAIPIVAPPSDGDEEDEEAGAASAPGIPAIHVEPASGSEDEAVVPDKSESGDSGHEEDSCSEPDSAQDFGAETNERTR